MDIAAMLHELAEVIGASGQARAVYGEPLKLDTQTVIPVAVVMARLGGGGGTAPVIGGGGGGGMRLDVLPVGFLHEKDGVAAFTPLDLPYERLARFSKDSRGRQASKGQDPDPDPDPSGLLAQLRRHLGKRS